jgi:hypothetical protein
MPNTDSRREQNDYSQRSGNRCRTGNSRNPARQHGQRFGGLGIDSLCKGRFKVAVAVSVK